MSRIHDAQTDNTRGLWVALPRYLLRSASVSFSSLRKMLCPRRCLSFSIPKRCSVTAVRSCETDEAKRYRRRLESARRVAHPHSDSRDVAFLVRIE
jgi:hypothetical protein